jgi:peptidoglycan/LPS O-acetylase OafA/YrhL
MPDGMRWARDATDTRADSILFGCVLACLQQTPLCEGVFQRRRLERYIIPGCLATLLLTFLVRNPIFRETLRYTLQGLAIAPLLYYVVHYPETGVGKLLNTRVLSYIGVLSYSLYLLHAVVLLQMHRIVHGAASSRAIEPSHYDRTGSSHSDLDREASGEVARGSQIQTFSPVGCPKTCPISRSV